MCETSVTTKPESVAQLVNEMRVLIQEMKTIIEAVTEKLSKDPNTKATTSQERQAKPYRKSSRVLTSEVTSVVGPLQTPPKRKTKGIPSPDGQEHSTKQEKNRSNSRTRTTPRKDRFNPWKQKLPFAKLGKYRWTRKWKMKKQVAHSKCSREQSHLYKLNTSILKN